MVNSKISSEKNSKKQELQKQRFILDVEGFAPIQLRVELWAYDEEDALKNLDNPRWPKVIRSQVIDLPRLKRKKITIKEFLTSLVKLVKIF